MISRTRLLSAGLATMALAVASALPPAAQALFHFAVIDEVVGSYDGDAGQQYIEIRMLAGAQNFVAHSVLAAFDANGNYLGDLIEVPSNVANSGAGVRWIVATADFQSEQGFTADFTMAQGVLPASGGMVCFGGGGGIVPANPPSWSRTNFASYVDCVAYGNYSGGLNSHVGTPTSRAPLDHALQRGTSTNNNSVDFTCSDSLTPTNNAGATLMLSSTIPCTCGNAALDGGEACDDGNQVTGDCCGRECGFEIAGSACASDAVECTDDVCDGSGACTHPNSALGTPCTADSNQCTDDVCDGAAACTHPDNTAPCDDGNPCTTADVCGGGACTATEDPVNPVSCFAAASLKSSLILRNNADDTKDSFNWTWAKGDQTTLADFGDPVLGTTDYSLCVYDQSGPASASRIRYRGDAVRNSMGTCAGKPCWKAPKSGFAYADKELTPHGLKSAKVVRGDPGKSRAGATGKGVNLAMPALPLTGTVTVQLKNTLGKCWSATYSTPASVRDPAVLWKAKSD